MQQDQHGREQNEAIELEASVLMESCLCGCSLSKFRQEPLEKLSCTCEESPLCFLNFDLSIKVSKATSPARKNASAVCQCEFKSQLKRSIFFVLIQLKQQVLRMAKREVYKYKVSIDRSDKTAKLLQSYGQPLASIKIY